jgi:hypothetical protein
MAWKASALAGLSLSLVPSFDARAQGQPPLPVELVSIGTDGLAGNHHSGSDGIIPPRTRISADGRYVVFESYAGSLVCQDNDFSTRDIFVRDRLTDRTTVASVASDGGEANARPEAVTRAGILHGPTCRIRDLARSPSWSQ